MNILKLLLFPLFPFLVFNNIRINPCIDNIKQFSHKIRHRHIQKKYQTFGIFIQNARILNCHFAFKWDLSIVNYFQIVIFGGTIGRLSSWKSSFHNIKLCGMPFFFLFWGDRAILLSSSFVPGEILNDVYFPVLVPVGLTGNTLSFLVVFS